MNSTTANDDSLLASAFPSSLLLFDATTAPSLAPSIIDTVPSDLTDGQQKALALIPIFSGALSAWGSMNIIYSVLCKAQTKHCYNRIMLGLSCSDLVSSVVLSLQAFLLPADTSPRVWVIGNDATCTAMGFFQQLSMASILYSGMLSYMYLLTIRHAVSEEILVKCYEPWMHIVSISFAVGSAALGVILGLYKEVSIGAFCWFAGPPPSTLVAYFVGGFPGFVTLVIVILNNVRIYCHVRTTRSTSTGSMDTIHNIATINTIHYSRQTSTSGSSAESAQSTYSDEQLLRQEELREMQRERERLSSIQERRKNDTRAVARVGFYYVAAFLLTYLPTFVLRPLAAQLELERSSESKVFWLLVIQAIFWPMQGLYNYAIYSRTPTSYLREIH